MATRKVKPQREKRAPRLKWEAHEETLLRELYRSTKVDALAARLGRTPNAIIIHASVLGLTQRHVKKKVNWTEEDIRFLVENYRSMKKTDICAHLGMSHGTIYPKAIELGLIEKRYIGGLVSCSATLDQESVFFATQLGNGNFSKGLRIAVKYAAAAHGLTAPNQEPNAEN